MISVKNSRFIWGQKVHKAFETLKNSLVTAPIMQNPRQDGMLILDTDASDHCMGAVLLHLKEDNGVVEKSPIAYASKKFDVRETMAPDARNF